MKFKYLYLTAILFAAVTSGCREDSLGGITPGEEAIHSNSAIVLTSARSDSRINLSVEAPEASRPGVWIDLDGNGVRAENGSEDVSAFNGFEEYTVVGNPSRITIHGDITYLGCAANELTAIDISENPHLLTLNCPLNRLTDIDVSKNAGLKRIDCSHNQLQTLDVSSNPALVSLWCFNNSLSDLDVSKNTALSFLDCSSNALNKLDLSNNTQLNKLLCYGNRLSTLDVSRNEALTQLWLFGNVFDDAEIARVVSALRRVNIGDLWISNKPAGEELKALAADKGWSLH